MKGRGSPLIAALAGITLLFAGAAWADVPAPPVNQTIGMLDVLIGDLTEADCRVCHTSGVPDRHHMLYGQPIPPGSLVPYPDADGDLIPDTIYGCLNCHDTDFTVVRDCITCHTTSAHHTTPTADDWDCVACHGDIVDNMDDGHYIPTYAPSLVTPTRSMGDGLPLNSRDNGAGACNYCHDEDALIPPVILNNNDLHHGAGLADFSSKCDGCHDFALPFEEQIRVCEGCHGPDSLHNIQADSPAPGNIGILVVGGEDAGYGHVGRDAGPADSDCWGCHGFSVASAPSTGPIVPSISSSDLAVMAAGTDTPATLTGSGFTNVYGITEYTSVAVLTAADGSSIELTPDAISEGSLTVTIPGTTPVGNYDVQAAKDTARSNPVVVSITPSVEIRGMRCSKCLGVVTITGSGFGDTPPEGSEEYLYVEENGATLNIRSWTDTRIQATGSSCRGYVLLNTLYGSKVRWHRR